MNDYSFGNFIYKLRSEKGLSQAQLGELLGVTNKAVSKWENGSAKPNTRLLPKIAEILGVNVEELFACKRLETNNELEQAKQYLAQQKRKYAILSSVFLSAIIVLPLLLIEFTCVVMGFKLPDDILGPLGSMFFILTYIISLTSYVIYRKNFKQTLYPSETSFSNKFSCLIKNGILYSSISWLSFFALSFFVYSLIIFCSSDYTTANIFLAIAILILIILSGFLVCLLNIKRLLKIKTSAKHENRRKPIQFSSLPVWGKVCYIANILLFPFVLSVQIFYLFNDDYLFIKLISLILWYVFALPLIIYNIKNK